jgi:glycine cleavage system aminomethyltransferase T
VAAGMNTIGIMSSAGVGKAMAEWIRDGEAPMDLWSVDIARADPLWNEDAFLSQRTPEAVAQQFAVHWPGKQFVSGRNLRLSPLHQAWSQQGAVSGVSGGWERPLWFARAADEKEMRYGYGPQHWWPMAEREARAMAAGVALIELTPFSKIAVEGPDAESFLQRVAAGDVDVPPGRCVYTQMLNERGGIEADLTIRRDGESAYRIIGGAPTRWRDLARLRKLAGDARVTVTDHSEDEAVLGVMGPEAAALIERAGIDGCDLSGLAFSTAASARIAGVPVTLQRLSYAGEYGFELYVARTQATRLHAALARDGIPGLGLNALDGCRLEKGFRHWGHDIGPDDTPLEAGLGFAVAFDKPHDFIGRTALERQKEKGPTRRLVLFEADPSVPLLLHDEPIYRDGERVGLTTSGGRGPRTGKMLCFGYVTMAENVLSAPHEVAIAGKRFLLTALTRPPYDPKGLRMRRERISA